MKCNVPVAEAINDEGVLPERVQEALGQLVGAAKEGLLALSVEVGLGVLRELLEAEVEELVGPKGKWNPDRTAVRHGHEDGEVTLGGRRVRVKRPRARTADGESEVPLVTYEHFADRDQLGDVVLERMLAGVSTRQYRRAQEPVGSEVEADARSTSKSAVSRDVRAADPRSAVEADEPAAGGPAPGGDDARRDRAARPHEHRRARDHDRGRQARARAVGRVDRERDGRGRAARRPGRPRARRRAGAAVRDRRIEGACGRPIRQVFGNDVPVQRCVQHKERNVLDHLPERDRQAVKARLRRAWAETDHDRALEQLNALALELDRAHPGAAASLREGMEETLTVTRLGITGKLKLTLQSTNPIESMISTVRVIHRNVKHWSSGEMCLRWTAAGMLEAETRFRKVQGYRGLANLAVAIETRPHPSPSECHPHPNQEHATALTV